MRLALSLLFLFWSQGDFASPSVNMARALELLQKNKKSEALILLEKAFADSIDPLEMKHLAVLILEASPLDYPKRDAFLRYLVRFSPDHPKYSDWLKELGDRSFQMGEMDAAEDWYLRASVFAKTPDSKALLDYQLSFVYWNKKNPKKAFELMSTAFENSERLRSKLHPELAKLWWNQMSLSQIPKSWRAWSDQDKQVLIKELFKISLMASPSELKSFFEIMAAEEWLKNLLLNEILMQPKVFHEPCLLFEIFLEPGDSVTEELIFSCLNSGKSMNQARLLEFLQAFEGQRSDQFHLAHIDLLVQTKQKSKAAFLGLSTLDRLGEHKEFFDVLDQLLLSLSDGEWLEIHQSMRESAFKNFLRRHPRAKVISRLQSTSPGIWFSFQEEEMPSSLDKSFWIRKSNWQVSQNLTQEDLNFVRDKILSFEPTQEERNVQLVWVQMSEGNKSALPAVFGPEFLNRFEVRIKDFDRHILDFQNSDIEWKKLAEVHMRTKIQETLTLIRGQIIDLQMPADFSEQTEEFSKKKQKILDSLTEKYRRWEGVR